MKTDRKFRATVGVICIATLLVAGAGAVSTVLAGGGDVTAAQETTPEDEQAENVSIQNLSAPEQVQLGENYTVSADVVNEGDEEAVRRVTYRLGGNVIASQLVQIPTNNATMVVFNVTGANTSGFPAGTFTHGVFTEDSEATANLTLVGAETTPAETTPNETTPAETTPTETTPEAETPPEETTPQATTPETTPEETTPEETQPAETPVETTPMETTPAETTPAETSPVETTPEEADAARLTFESQTSNGTAVVVDSVTVPEGGFVVVHDTGILQGEVVESIVGQSDYLEAGTQQNVTVELDQPLNESQRLVAVAYRDSNGNETFDFVTSNRTIDGPYRQPGGETAVSDFANVTVENGEGEESEEQEGEEGA